MRTAAIGIAEAVFVREVPRAVHFAALALDIRISSQAGYRTSNEKWGLRVQKVRFLLPSIPPICLSHTKVVKHSFASQKAWR